MSVRAAGNPTVVTDASGFRTRVFGAVGALNFNAVVFQLVHPVFTCETTVHDDHAVNSSVVDEFCTHHAGFTRDDEPGVVGGHTVGRSVADQVHFRMVTTDFDPRTRFDVHGVAKALLSAAQTPTASRAAVVAVHQHNVAFGVNQQRTKGSSRTV